MVMKSYGAWVGANASDGLISKQHPQSPQKKINSVGPHSRTGKAALWASANEPSMAHAPMPMNLAAEEQRFSRRKVWGNRRTINTRFPYWFC